MALILIQLFFALCTLGSFQTKLKVASLLYSHYVIPQILFLTILTDGSQTFYMKKHSYISQTFSHVYILLSVFSLKPWISSCKIWLLTSRHFWVCLWIVFIHKKKHSIQYEVCFFVIIYTGQNELMTVRIKWILLIM